LRRFARSDRRCLALQTIYGVGPILACHLLAELGEGARFHRARQAVGAAGLDPCGVKKFDSGRDGRVGGRGRAGSECASC
jgi:transposase